MNQNPLHGQRRRMLGYVAASILAGSAAWALTPRRRLSDLQGSLHLSDLIPTQFGAWRVDPLQQAGIVNPQLQEVINRIYSDTLSRTYVRTDGRRIMLSVAYGSDQRDGMQVHYPEVCYPAQGFQIRAQRRDNLRVHGLTIPVKRLLTNLGSGRIEPVTYWIVVGETAIRSNTEMKFVEMVYGLKGIVPDGLIFRVSSIGENESEEFAMQDDFVSQVYGAVSYTHKERIFGASRV